MTGSNTSTAAASSSEIPPFTKRQQLEQKLSFITAHYSSDVHLITQKILTDLNQQRKAGTPLPSCLTIWLLKAEGPYPNLLCQLFHITCMCMVTKQSGFLLPPFWKGSFIYLTCMNHKGKSFHHKVLKTWDFIPVTAAFFLPSALSSPFLSKLLSNDITPNASSSSSTAQSLACSSGSAVGGLLVASYFQTKHCGAEFIYQSVCSAQECEEYNQGHGNSRETATAWDH